ncbi:MAG TPA: porin [Burkholderiaceae bacterium]|nr:porin [Burkholderiaceae bacterium]
MNAKYAHLRTAAVAGIALASVTAARAGDGSIVVYGVVDTFVGHMAANGKSITALDDNGLLVSRIGFRGFESLGGDTRVKFALENGFNPVTGAQKDGNRLFDRQAWVGYESSIGEFRAGRQNTKLFLIGDDVDASQRATFASFINNTGVVARYDNDLAYISPKWAGVDAELHHAFGGQAGSANGGTINQAAIEYRGQAVPLYLAAYDLQAKPFSGQAYTSTVNVETIVANLDYGRGKVYYAWERTNNITGFGSGQALSNVGGYAPGTSPVAAAAASYYDFNQASVDFRPTPGSSLGLIYGVGKDKSGGGNGVRGGGLVGEFDLSRRTRIYAAYGFLKNDHLAAFKLSGGGAPTKNLATADVEGQTVRGFQAGVRFFF